MSFGLLSLICAVALIGPLLSLPHWLRLPVVVGELAVGIVLGATGLRWLDAGNPTLSFLGNVGFALVMFVAGSHVPVRDPAMRAGLRTGVLRAAGIGVLAVPAGLALARLFGDGHGWLYAVLIASSSAALVLPAVGDDLTRSGIVELVPQVAIADAACIVALPLAIDPGHAWRALVGAVLVAAAATALFFVLRALERSGLRHRAHTVSEDHGLAIELRTSLALLFALAALAQVAHVSIMLAGFAFGVALAAVGEPRRLARQVFALSEGFFNPIFFVWLGASLNLRLLAAAPSAVWLGLMLGLVAVAVHALVGLVTRQDVRLAAVTSGQLGVPMAAVALGQTSGLLTGGQPAALLLGAVVTIVAVSLGSALVRRRNAVPAG